MHHTHVRPRPIFDHPTTRAAHRRRLAGALGVVLLASVRCQTLLDPQPLQRFETCEDLQLYLEDQILDPGVEQSFATGGPMVGCALPVSESAVPMDGSAEGEGETGRSFTTTNTQEVDVDEPDFVKNNGDLIFVLRRSEMVILSAWPADEMHVLSRTLMGGTPFTMIFDDDSDRALVVAHAFTDRQVTLARLYDVSDPTAPALLREVSADGAFVDARAVGSEVMLVTSATLDVNVALDTAPFKDDENRARLRALGVDRLLPRVSDFIVGEDTAPRVDTAVACDNTYAPSRSDGRSILLVHALDMADALAPLRSTGVVAQFSHVYGSTSSLYLAATEWSDGGFFTPHIATTRIHKLSAFDGTGAAEYQATGVIMGTIKDELSLDEDADGHLRVVVTDNSEANDVASLSTALLVLEQNPEDSTQLIELARVDDIGRGENVESVRFVDDKAYVVTYPADAPFFLDGSGMPSIPFVDPLFVIDLADPRAPRLRGELKVDGYSAYLHPYDEDHLLAVGVNTSPETGEYLGLSLILFDVSDPDRPTERHRLDFGGPSTGSEALVDRHAFTYFSAERALAIPVQDVDTNTGALISSRLAVFRVDVGAGFIPMGGLEQRDFYPELLDSGLLAADGFTPAAPCAAVRRSIMVADSSEGSFVYAVSTGGITAAHLTDDLPVVSNVTLRRDNEGLCDFLGTPL